MGASAKSCSLLTSRWMLSPGDRQPDPVLRVSGPRVSFAVALTQQDDDGGVDSSPSWGVPATSPSQAAGALARTGSDVPTSPDSASADPTSSDVDSDDSIIPPLPAPGTTPRPAPSRQVGAARQLAADVDLDLSIVTPAAPSTTHDHPVETAANKRSLSGSEEADIVDIVSPSNANANDGGIVGHGDDDVVVVLSNSPLPDETMAGAVTPTPPPVLARFAIPKYMKPAGDAPLASALLASARAVGVVLSQVRLHCSLAEDCCCQCPGCGYVGDVVPALCSPYRLTSCWMPTSLTPLTTLATFTLGSVDGPGGGSRRSIRRHERSLIAGTGSPRLRPSHSVVSAQTRVQQLPRDADILLTHPG